MSTVSEDIAKGFQSKLQSDMQLKTILKGIRTNGGDYKDAEKYAGSAGRLLTEVFKANITPGNFPVGSVKDIASLIVPTMELNHKAVTQVAGMVQKALNKDGGFGMNPIMTQFDKSSAYNLVGRMAKYESFEDAAFLLDEPVQTASRSMTDSMLHENADFQYKSGMRPKIVRTCESGACEWCQMLEGEYDYDEVKDRGDPVYQRHNNCVCEITYEPGDGRVQDVYSKQWYDEQNAKRRINTTKHNEQEKNADDQTRRDRLILNSNEQSRRTPGPNENTVISPIIESEEFNDRVSKVDEDKRITNRILHEGRTTLYHRNGTLKEDMTFINTVTNEFKSQRNYNKDGECLTTKAMKDMILNSKPRTIIGIHNHPRNMMPSYSDLKAAKNYKYGVILCHNGNVIKYSVSDNANLGMADFILNDLQRDFDAGNSIEDNWICLNKQV